jgi:predicted exporter
VTREIVPALAGPGAVTDRGFSLPPKLESAIGGMRALKWPAWAIAIGSLGVVFFTSHLWEDDLSALNPVPEALKAADRDLRRELGAPDVRHLLIVRGAAREAALEQAEALEPKLADLKRRGAIGGYDLATRYVPSEAEQKRRLAALPDPVSLKNNLDDALRGLPYRKGAFEPFLREAEESRRRGPLRDEDLQGTVLGIKVQTLVVPSGKEWAVLVPLAGVADAQAVARELPLVDIKAESEKLLAGYRAEALRLTALGMGAIVLALGLGLRSARAVAQVMLPVLLALLASAAALLVFGQRLTVFHLIAMLLVMGIGLNYALFFDRPEADPDVRRRTLLALVVNCATTVIAFGTLAWSSNPVLNAIGLTVTVGALAALFFSGSFARKTA